MDIDENDILYNNVFIPQAELSNEISSDSNDEFRKFYKKEQSINEEKKMRDNMSIRSVKSIQSIRSMQLAEETDSSSIMNSNKFNINPNTSIKSFDQLGKQNSNRKKKEILTYVSIDSRDRDTILYKKPNYLKIFLGKTFYNVKSIRLSSVEFPNTNAVINSSNHHIYWRNQQDISTDTIDSITKTYPEYSVQLRIGSYISTSLQTEMTNKLATVKRLNKLGDYHYFIVSLDIDTDIVTFTSLILTQLSNNPLTTSVNTGVVEVNAPSHGYADGEYIYLVGAKTIAGIPSSTLNTSHKISVINSGVFRFEINVKAGETLQGGGNTMKSGRIAPFQFLFGIYDTTVAQNIGYPLENSSQLINTYIKSITNFYEVVIVTKTEHGFLSTFDYIGQTCTVSSAGTTPTINGSKVITSIISTTSFTIQVSNKLIIGSYNLGQITFNGNTFNIQSIGNSTSNTVLVSTFADHNYSLTDIGLSVTLYNTTTVPIFDGINTIYSLFATNSFVIQGSIPTGGEVTVTVPGTAGSTPRNNPLTTYTVPITNVVIGSSTLSLTCPNHKFQIGDTITIFNLLTSPIITNQILTIYSIPTSNTIVINTTISSFNNTNILNGTAYVGSGLFTLSFPNHGFNKVISIQNTGGYPSGQTIGNLLLVQTQLPHYFTDNQLVRIMQSNSTPSVDGSYNISNLTSDTFTIPYSYPIVNPSTSGILGFNQNFYLYGSIDTGGILSTSINKSSYTVRDIIDENTFTLYKQNTSATSTEVGGGNNIYISSLLHGFKGEQTNTKNNLLNRSINLQGENYAFLCCPQLATMMNTGNVKNIFARISLDQSPGSMVFSYLSNPKVFDTVPLDKLEDLEFSIVNHDGSLYEFNDLDYSFTLEITEVIDISDNFNLSSKRGITDN